MKESRVPLRKPQLHKNLPKVQFEFTEIPFVKKTAIDKIQVKILTLMMKKKLTLRIYSTWHMQRGSFGLIKLKLL